MDANTQQNDVPNESQRDEGEHSYTLEELQHNRAILSEQLDNIKNPKTIEIAPLNNYGIDKVNSFIKLFQKMDDEAKHNMITTIARQNKINPTMISYKTIEEREVKYYTTKIMETIATIDQMISDREQYDETDSDYETDSNDNEPTDLPES